MPLKERKPIHHVNAEIIFILAEASLELIPKTLYKHPDVIRYARFRKKRTDRLILDATYHYRAMRNAKLDNLNKRGRPDIVHRALLLLQDSLLNKHGFLRVYIHTITGDIIWINPKARLPRHYIRFIGLMEKLFEGGIIYSSETNEKLLELLKLDYESLIKRLKPVRVIGFSRHGVLVKDLTSFLIKISNSPKNLRVINVIGAFPKGKFSDNIIKSFDTLVSLSSHSLSTQYVVCKVLNAYEQLIFSHY